VRSSIRPGAWASRQRSGRQSPAPIRTIPVSCCESRAPGSRRRRAELGFWREVVRFFCALDHGRGHGHFAITLRMPPAQSGVCPQGPLASLGRQMRERHRDLEAIERIEVARRRAEAAHVRARGQASACEAASSGSWCCDRGVVVEPPATKDRFKREEYLVIQLRTAADLGAETRAMHHCVASYAACRVRVDLVATPPCRRQYRLLTIELDRQHRAIQFEDSPTARHIPRSESS
jgi:hypothetical protein